MFVTITYTAKMTKNRESRQTGNVLQRDQLVINFDKDIDWNEPVFMILETEKAPGKVEHFRGIDDPVEFGSIPLDKVAQK